MHESRPAATRVLLVEDDEPIRRSRAATLEGRGYLVSAVSDGARALEEFVRFAPDIVVTDLRLTGPHGLALIHSLRDLDDTVPVVVVCGAADIKAAVGAHREGAWDYLLDPTEHDDELDATIRRNLERAGLLRKNRRHLADLEQLVRQRTAELQVNLVHQPVSDLDGRFLGHRGTTRDITERKRLESLVLRMHRQESLGRLSSGIAHDLNNVLAPIMMAGDLLQTASLTSAERECVEIIRSSSERGADLVRQLLTFSRAVDGHRLPLNPGAIVRDVARLVSETFPRDIDVQLSLPADVWPVEADRTHLHQVALSLCLNARDAMAEGGTLSLALERVELDEFGANLVPPARPGPYVVLTVADSGHGIPADILDRIFDPSFTTKASELGSELGLSIVHSIVANHGGFVDVHSVVGQGTEFRVYLPAAVSRGGPSEPGTGDAVARGNGQRVLVVDDERLVREMLRRTLETHGYAVTVAESGAHALEVHGQDPGAYDVVLMDIWMPHMDGLSTIRRLAGVDPRARVIAMSGLADVRETALGTSPVVKMFLLKPWRSAELLAAIHGLCVDQGREGNR